MPNPKLVHVVSHGPHCLDGVAAAAAIARYHAGIETRARFAGNSEIDEVLLGLELEPPFDEQELWITDISWTNPETDRRLRDLAGRGLPIVWIDHHKTAIERLASGEIDVPFAERIVDDRYAAAKLTYDHLAERLRAAGTTLPSFEAFAPVIAMADDNDRWIHAIDGSWKLALTLRAMNSPLAFDDLVTIGEDVAYTPRMLEAHARVDQELRASFSLAERTRKNRELEGGLRVVSAVCMGYPSEIGDKWGRAQPNTVFALLDLTSGAISYRRSPDCTVDLSHVAKQFGGGGHPAAAGSELLEALEAASDVTGSRIAAAVTRL